MQVYLAGENLKKRGFPADRTLVLALDVEKHEWVVQPNPTDGILPPVESMRMVHHYYDPVHNATLKQGAGWSKRRLRRDHTSRIH